MRKKLVRLLKENKFSVIYFSVVAIVFLFSRLMYLSSVPNGMHIDEVAMGYNVWSLSNYGVDRYGVSFPVYFNNSGSGQSSLYIYIAVLLAKVFGYNIITLRLPAVFLGLLLLIFSTLLSYEMFGIKSAYITSFIIVIMPVFIMGERWAFDCVAFLPVFAMILYFAIKLLKTEKIRYAVMLGVCVSISFYSYILAFIIVPILLLLSAIYCLIYKKVSIKNIIVTGISALILSIPIFSYILVVFGVLNPFKIGNISITDASFQRVSELRWQGIGFGTFFKYLFEVTDRDNYNFVADEKYGVFYSNRLIVLSLSQILILCGFMAVLGFCIYKNYKKDFNYETILVIGVLGTLFPLFVTDGFAIYRYESFLLICAFLLSYVFDLLWKKNQRVLSCLIALVFVFNFMSYVGYIFSSEYADSRLAYFDTELLDLCESLDLSDYQDYEIYVDNTTTYNTGLIVLYGLRVPPDEIGEVKNMDISNMTYKNIHIGIPDKVIDNEKAIYVIKDLDKGASLYTDIENPISLYENLVKSNNARKKLASMGAKQERYNDYYIYYTY